MALNRCDILEHALTLLAFGSSLAAALRHEGESECADVFGIVVNTNDI
jgi:hypothetical protein